MVERTLHAALLADPRRPVDPADIAAIADADARENWAVMIAWRDLLVAHRTIEAAYCILRGNMGRTPPLFVNQLVHVILRNVLDDCEDAFMLRAAELFFRPQRLTSHGGSLIAADDELIAGASSHSSPLVSMLGLPANAEIDVLNDDNAATYWARSDRFDTALDLTVVRRGLAALGDVTCDGSRTCSPIAGSSHSQHCAEWISPGMSASTRRRPRSGMRYGAARKSMTARNRD